MAGYSDGWEKYIEYSKNKKMSLFIFDLDTLKFYNWDTIRKYNKYVKRYDIGIDDVRKKGWYITFPWENDL